MINECPIDSSFNAVRWHDRTRPSKLIDDDVTMKRCRSRYIKYTKSPLQMDAIGQ